MEKGSKHWMADVILKSHPAGEDKPQEGMVVLAKFDSYDGFPDEKHANKRFPGAWHTTAT
ncbi:hypothetical protein [Sediminispirochaeta smaragdinae]|uniref:hypothetical protein n=1 Tax=Sediminispirochaeta smaragdinae TaxID=55206 RepID=UPI0005A48751|nr:hypothetical protein [Sediminispirochaeta smaragdinae]